MAAKSLFRKARHVYPTRDPRFLISPFVHCSDPPLKVLAVETHLELSRISPRVLSALEQASTQPLSAKNPVIRYLVYGEEHCILRNDLLRCFHRQKRANDPFSGLPFLPEDLQWIQTGQLKANT